MSVIYTGNSPSESKRNHLRAFSTVSGGTFPDGAVCLFVSLSKYNRAVKVLLHIIL